MSGKSAEWGNETSAPLTGHLGLHVSQEESTTGGTIPNHRALEKKKRKSRFGCGLDATKKGVDIGESRKKRTMGKASKRREKREENIRDCIKTLPTGQDKTDLQKGFIQNPNK